MKYEEYLKYTGYYPDLCMFDEERWGEAICEGCNKSRQERDTGAYECPEDFTAGTCPRQGLVTELSQIAFEANEKIRELLGIRLNA